MYIIDDPLFNRIIEEAVDREVPAQGILLRSRITHAGRMPAIQVGALAAKGCYIIGMAIHAYLDNAKFGANGCGVGKYLEHLFRQGAGGDIDVLRLSPKQKISDPPAGKVSLVTMQA